MSEFLASPFAAQPAALFAGLLLAWLILRLGRGAFSLRLFGAALAVGAVMGTLIVHMETPFQLRANPYGFSPFTIAFGFAGFAEEAAKLAGAYFFLRPHYLRRNSRDLALAAASAALGFALFENMLYIAAAGEHWGRLAFIRALTAVPFHVFLGLIGGWALARAEYSEGKSRSGSRIAATWIALGTLHGAYDLPIFLLNAKAPLPAYVVRASDRIGLAPATLLYGLMLCVLVCVCVAAFASLRALDRPPFPPIEPARRPSVEGRWLRLGLARGTGTALAGLLIAPSLIALAISAVLAFVADQILAVQLFAIGVACPITVGLMLLAFPPMPRNRAMSLRRRRGLQAASALAAVLGLLAAYRWGQGPVRDLIATSIEVRGIQSAMRGDHERALREYDRALAFDPGLVDALAKRAASNGALERYDRALSDLDEAILLRPDNVDLYIRRSEVHRSRHESLAVIADVQRALDLAPRAPALWALSAQAYLEARDVAKARAVIAQAARLGPRDPMTLRVEATVLTWDGAIDKALQALDADLSANPKDGPAMFFRGRLWLYQQDPRKAAEDFQRADEQLTFLYPALWRFLARTRMGEDGGPELSARVLKSGDYKWPYPVTLLFLGQKTAAETRAAAANDDQRCEADFYAGELLLSQGKTEPARESLRVALDECPADFIEYEGARAELRRLDSDGAGG